MKHFSFIRSLMMLAALGASVSAFAVGKPQVYDVRLVLRTTVAQSDMLSSADNPLLTGWEEADRVVYRETKTVTWHGLIWGVGSNAIAGRWELVTDALEQDRVGGCVMWDAKTKAITYLADGTDLTDVESVPGACFGWQFFNVIGQGGRLCEGLWTATQYGETGCGDGDDLFEMTGSGFGTLALTATRDDDGVLYVMDNSRIESMTGDLTGWMRTPTSVTADGGCTFCGGDVTCDYATAWDYCVCTSLHDESRTAVHGTWVIKYNPFYSYQYGKVTSVLDTDCFTDLPNVSAAVYTVESIVRGE